MNWRLKRYIREKEAEETRATMDLARQDGVLAPGQSLLVRIVLCEGPGAHSTRKRTQIYDRPITAEEIGHAFGMRLSESDRRVLNLLRENNGGPVHSSQLALAVGKDKFFSDDLNRLNYRLGKLQPSLRIVTTSRGRSTDDSCWRIVEIANP